MISEPFPLFLFITSTIAFSYVLTQISRFAQRFGVVMLVILLGLLCGNIDLVPQAAAVYDPFVTYLIPLSIALLLFRLDFRELRKLKGQLLFYYFVGTLGTILGVIVAWLLLGDRLGSDVGRLAGQLGASYIGGGENAVAVAEALGLRQDNPHLFSAAFAADNIVTAIWMMIALSAPFGFSRYFSNEITAEQLEAAKENMAPIGAAHFLPSCFYSLALAGSIIWISGNIAMPIKAFAIAQGWAWMQFNTSILWVTSIALIVAQTPLRRHLQVSYSLGMLFFLYFFFTMGAVSSIDEIVRLGPAVFGFTLLIVLIHGAVVLTTAKVCKGDMASVFIASQCNIGGPSTAVALAEANGWPHMIVPSILLGVLGYAIANYIGVFLAQILG
jgi:uncharacterized membrane protein